MILFIIVNLFPFLKICYFMQVETHNRHSDNGGNLAMTVERKMTTWEFYIEELFREYLQNWITWHTQLENKVKKALEQSKNGHRSACDTSWNYESAEWSEHEKTNRAVQRYLWFWPDSIKIVLVSLELK